MRKALCATEVPSGYLKDSVPPKIPDICHVGQLFNTQKTFDINQIHKRLTMAGAGGVGGDRISALNTMILRYPFSVDP